MAKVTVSGTSCQTYKVTRKVRPTQGEKVTWENKINNSGIQVILPPNVQNIFEPGTPAMIPIPANGKDGAKIDQNSTSGAGGTYMVLVVKDNCYARASDPEVEVK